MCGAGGTHSLEWTSSESFLLGICGELKNSFSRIFSIFILPFQRTISPLGIAAFFASSRNNAIVDMLGNINIALFAILHPSPDSVSACAAQVWARAARVGYAR